MKACITGHEEAGASAPASCCLRRRRVALAVAICLSLAAWSTGAILPMPPVSTGDNYTATDKRGMRYDINTSGCFLYRGQNNLFSGAGVLYISGSGISWTKAFKNAAGTEFKAEGQYSNTLRVTRLASVDLNRGCVRFVDQVENISTNIVKTNLQVRTSFNVQCQGFVLDTGKPVGGGSSSTTTYALAKNESALLGWTSSSSYPMAIFYLAHGQGKVRPQLQLRSNSRIYADYPVEIPPGKSVSIVHAIAQRPGNSLPPPGQIRTLVAEFGGWKLTRGLPASVQRSIVNFPSSGYWVDLTMGKMTDWSGLSVHRGPDDVLVLDKMVRLRGTATCKDVTVTGRFGQATIPAAKVLAIAGGKHHGKYARLFLRDGQVLWGEVAAEMRFASDNGLILDMPIATLDLLVMRESPDDARAGKDVVAFVDTVDAQRLAVKPSDAKPLSVTAAWGRVAVDLTKIRTLEPLGEHEPGHRLHLDDGSRLACYVDEGEVPVETVWFGRQTLPLAQVRAIWKVGATGKNVRDVEFPHPHVALAGGNVLVGRVALEQIHLKTAGRELAVPLAQVRRLTRYGDDAREMAVRIEMWTGDPLVGALTDAVLPVRSGKLVWQVPAGDLVGIAAPAPAIPPAARRQIAALIDQLGSPDWKERDEATAKLKRLGPACRTLLYDAMKTAEDPEVLRRLAKLLQR